MALTLGGIGNNAGQWVAGDGKPGSPGIQWSGPGPAPQATMQQQLQSMGAMSKLNSPYNASQLGGTVSPAVQPGATQLQQPGGMTGQQLQAWIDASPENAAAFNAKYTASQQIPTGTSGYQTSNPTMQPNTPKYGLAGAEEGLQRGLQGGLAGLEAGVNQAASTLSPYTQGGGKAFDLQSALSGAMGPEAQRQAFANYNQSPEMAYALEQAEKGITRNAAATGGLGSGNVLQELQRNAIGMAQQDYGNAFNRLGSLSQMGQGSANLLGGIQANAGGQAGQMAYGTGGQLANYRTRAGEQIAGNVQDTSQGLAGMINQQGNDLSSLVGNTGNSLANLLAGFGSADAQTQQALAALLANISTGSASQVAGVPGLPQAGQSGALDDIGKIISAFGKPPGTP